MKNSNTISVIIPTFNRDGYLYETIKDLLFQEINVEFEIIVVDQNQEIIGKRNPKLNCFINQSNLVYIHIPGKGVVSGRNTAINTSKGEIIVFIDDDVQIKDKNFLQKHLNNYTEYEEISAVCGREVNPGGDEYCHQLNYKRSDPLFDIFYFPRNYSKKVYATIFSTCNSSIRKEVLLNVGCFDQNFIGASYGDDSDLALRLTDTDLKILYDPEPFLIHLMAKTGGLRISDLNNKFNERAKIISRIVFYKKHIKRKNIKIKVFYIYNYILRTMIFNKVNLKRPWKIPYISFLIIKNYF